MPRQAVKQEELSCDPMSILDLCSRYRPLVLATVFHLTFAVHVSPVPHWDQRHIYPGVLMPNVGILRDASAGGFCPLIARPT